MKNLIVGVSIAFAFVLGCATALVGSDLIVPPARSADVQRWEYSCFRQYEGITDSANKLGAEGWELAASSAAFVQSGPASQMHMVWCFKRPL